MKALLTFVLALGFTCGAFAGNEGPQAAPKVPGLLAEAKVSIFFAPSTYPRVIRHQIFDDGHTQVVKTMRDNTETVQPLKPFSAEEMRAIKKNISEIVPGAFFDPNPSQPGCMDAPGETYKVFTKKGEIEIFKRFACKTQARKNANEADADLIEILHTLVRSE